MPRKMYRHTRRPASRIVKGEGRTSRLLEQNRFRITFIVAIFGFCFLMLSARLIEVSMVGGGELPFKKLVSDPMLMLQDEENRDGDIAVIKEPQRRQIVDRNGMVLATNMRSDSLVVNPSLIKEPKVVARKLVKVLTGVSYDALLDKLDKPNQKFAYLKRHLSPKEQEKVNYLGIPGLYFEQQTRRIYPFAGMISHVLGYVDIDNHGLTGIEKFYDQALLDPLKPNEPIALSLDMRMQSIVHEELKHAMQQTEALGAVGVMVDVRTGEVLAMSSLPSFDPHKVGAADENARFNRVTQGVYEMGSTFKTFTVAMALDKGLVGLNDTFDVSAPVVISGHPISDAHPSKIPLLSVSEIYAQSSNIGTVKIAMEVGAKNQREFLQRVGLMDKAEIELPERAAPLIPSEWREINMATISYGHGMSVTPLNLMQSVVSMVNGGMKARLTLVKEGNRDRPVKERLIKESTSHQIRTIMRQVVKYGTAKSANIPGYRVAGKTGTAEKTVNGQYKAKSKLTSFVSLFPSDNPAYALYVMIDEPKYTIIKSPSATGGSVAAPVVGNMIARMAPLLGIAPIFEALPTEEDPVWVVRHREALALKRQEVKEESEVHAASF